MRHRRLTIFLPWMATACLAAAGCGSSQAPATSMPMGEVLASGKGNLSAKAVRTGLISIMDETDHKLVWTGSAAVGDKIEVNASGDRIVVRGNTQSEPDLSPDHQYIIYDQK